MKNKKSVDPVKAHLHHYVAPLKNSNWARLYCPKFQSYGRVGFKTEDCKLGICTLCDAVVLNR